MFSGISSYILWVSGVVSGQRIPIPGGSEVTLSYLISLVFYMTIVHRTRPLKQISASVSCQGILIPGLRTRAAARKGIDMIQICVTIGVITRVRRVDSKPFRHVIVTQ